MTHEEKIKDQLEKIIDKIDISEMILKIWNQPWMAQCEILFNETEIKVRYNSGEEHPPYLRKLEKGGSFMPVNSKALNGYFWDVYGDSFDSIEAAVIAIAKAPRPASVEPETFTLHMK